MKTVVSALILFLLAGSAYAGNGGLVAGTNAAENKKFSYAAADAGPASHAGNTYDIPEDKKHTTAADDYEYAAPDYDLRGARNSINGVLAMWGKLITNALPSDEPLTTGKAKKPAAKP